MIPKVIHYCWVGGTPKPESVIHCIDSWKKHCPDYEIVEWNEENYDFSKNIYMKQAYDAKKWGFVPDYARLDIVYEHGGIYLDTDVEIIKNLDELLNQEAFFGFESSTDKEHYINCGQGFGASPHNDFIGELRDSYNTIEFLKNDGSIDLTPSPKLNTELFRKLGVALDNRMQIVNGITVYPSDYFCPKNFETGKTRITSRTLSIHHFTASWMDEQIKASIRHNQKITNLMGSKLGTIYLVLESSIQKNGIIGTTKKWAVRVHENIYRLLPIYKIKLLNLVRRDDKEDYAFLDTALESDNIGDQIIMKFCKNQLRGCIDIDSTIGVPTHRFPTNQELEEIEHRKKILCGTNALSGRMNKYGLWRIPRELNSYSDILLLGVGSGDTDDSVNYYTKLLLKNILSERGYHSVRDTYTFDLLCKIGIRNVIYTGCPTMWNLTPEFCKEIPVMKANEVIFTLNSYNANQEQDSALIKILLNNYGKVYFWPQGDGDEEYLKQIYCSDRITSIPADLDSYEKFLMHKNVDYIGLRLHGGILALNYKRRSIIISIDNRAEEIHRDTGLPIIPREKIGNLLNDAICRELKIRIDLPWDDINKWKQQFIN